MRALVIAHGEPPSPGLFMHLAAQAELVVAADGGALLALEHGILPDAVVGDLDSMAEHPDAAIPADRFHRSDDPDTTDLQKAIAFALKRGATAIDVVAAGGGRADHALANLSVLTIFRGIPVRMHDDQFIISLVDGQAEIEGAPGTLVSLVAIGECHGVTTKGMRWDLADFTLEFSPRGVHNELLGNRATVSVREGDLLLFEGRWVERHA
jgi:thiamine pyrophosphokinase